MALESTVTASIKGLQTGVNDLGVPLVSFERTLKAALSSTSPTTPVQKVFADTRTLAASATENLDFAAGNTGGPFGETQTWVTIKGILVAARSTNTNNVIVGGAPTNGIPGIFNDLTDKIIVKPGGVFLWVAPVTGATVTAATADLLLVANSAGGSSVDYDIIVVGT